MESYLSKNFGDVKPKNSSVEALERWRKLCGFVKNPKRRFRYTANLRKRSEAEAMRRSNQEKLRVAVMVSKAAVQFINGRKEVSIQICAEESVSINVEGYDVKNQIHDVVEGNASKLSTSVNNGISISDQLHGIKRRVIDGINKSTETVKRYLTFGWEAVHGMTLKIPGILVSVVSRVRTSSSTHNNIDNSSEFPESPHRPWALIACATDNNPDHLITQLVANLKSSSTEEQKKAALDIKSLTKVIRENRLKIAKAGAIPPLVSLMSSSDLEFQEYAVTAIFNLSLCDENKELITSSGAIKPLVQALMTGNRTTKENAAYALRHLSMTEKNKIEIGRSGAIPLLVNLLEKGELQGKKDAIRALSVLCSVNENKIKAVNAGIMKLLVEFMAADFNSDLLDKFARVLSMLVSMPEARTALVQEQDIAVLVKMVEFGSQMQIELALGILLQICEKSVECLNMVAGEGAFIPLLTLSKSGTNSAKQMAAALVALLRQVRSSDVSA